MTDVLRRGAPVVRPGEIESDRPLGHAERAASRPPPARRRTPFELLLVMVLALLAAALAWYEGPPVLRLPVGLLAGLILPGYAVSVALLPRCDDFHWAERLGLAFGLSLATICLMALALTYTPWGLHATPVTWSLTGITLLAASGGWWRRSRCLTTVDSDTEGEISRQASFSWGSRLGACALVAGVIVAGSALAYTLGTPPGPFTEFSILQADGLARDYPRAARTGEPMTVVVAVNNRERRTATFTVAVESGGATLTTTSPAEVGANDGWAAPLTFALPGSGKDQEIRILLFKDGEIEPYRQLRLWVDIGSVSVSPQILASTSVSGQDDTTPKTGANLLPPTIARRSDVPSTGAL